MKITYDTVSSTDKFVGIKFTPARAWPDITVAKLSESDRNNNLFWLPATVQVQNSTLAQPDAYILIAALHLALAEAAKLDAQYPVGSEVAK